MIKCVDGPMMLEWDEARLAEWIRELYNGFEPSPPAPYPGDEIIYLRLYRIIAAAEHEMPEIAPMLRRKVVNALVNVGAGYVPELGGDSLGFFLIASIIPFNAPALADRFQHLLNEGRLSSVSYRGHYLDQAATETLREFAKRHHSSSTPDAKPKPEKST